MPTGSHGHGEERRNVVENTHDIFDADSYKSLSANNGGCPPSRGPKLAGLASPVKGAPCLEHHGSKPAQTPPVSDCHTGSGRDAYSAEREFRGMRREGTAAVSPEDLVAATVEKGAVPSDFDALGPDDTTAQYRAQMGQNTQRVKQASNTLIKAERLLNDADEMGGDALQKLRIQTESLHRINGTTMDVNEEISETRKILMGMQRRMIKHKMMLMGIIIVLLFLIFVALYVSTWRRSEQQSQQPSQHSSDAPSIPSWSPQSGGGLPPE